MAYFRCSNGGGGGGFVSENLWTNQSPTSNFPDQTITLSKSMDNYEYIQVVVGMSTSQTSLTEEVLIKTSDLITAGWYGRGLATVYCKNGNHQDETYTRAFVKVQSDNTNTQLYIPYAYKVKSSSGYNGVLIPLEVNGLNFA